MEGRVKMLSAVLLCCCVMLGSTQVSAAPQPDANPVEDTKVIFAAFLGDGHIRPRTDITLVYKNVIANIGGGYNKVTGRFTAPMKGVYFFSITGHGYTNAPMGLRLMKNNIQVQSMNIDTTDKPHRSASATKTIIISLEKFDQVYIKLNPYNRIYDSDNSHSTFLGFLLYPL